MLLQIFSENLKWHFRFSTFLGDFTLHIIGGQNGSLSVARIDEQEFALEHLKAGHDETCGTGLGDGACVEIVDLHGAVEVEVKTHGG